jgi:hypothetical protein
MLKILLLNILAVGLLASANAPATTQTGQDAESTKKEVLQIEQKFTEALLTNDMSAVDSLSAADFLYVGTNAEILTKAQRHNQLESKLVRYEALQQDDLHVVVYGDTVIVSGRSTSTLLIGGKGSWGPGGASHLINPGRLSGNALFTHAYAKLRGRWQMILEHVTYITED